MGRWSTFLRQTISTLGRTMLETTTIDPGTTHGGAIQAEQIVIPDGAIRDMVIEVRFGGFPHRFRLNLVPSGAPTPADIPAVPAQVTQGLCAPARPALDRRSAAVAYDLQGRASDRVGCPDQRDQQPISARNTSDASLP